MDLTLTLTALVANRPTFQTGHVWLAGAGPGNAECLTLGVLSALQEADAVVYDALVDDSVMAFAGDADLYFVGKRGGHPSIGQEEINQQLITLAQAGKRVLRLKGGDPFIFGRGGDEALALTQAGISFRILPGVTAASGAAASAVIPTTMRGVNKAVILATGHGANTDDDIDWQALARTGQPIIIYMGLRNLPLITAALMQGGLPSDTPAAAVMSATCADEKILESTLHDLSQAVIDANFHAPTLIFVGEIVPMRGQLTADLATLSHRGDTP